MDRQSDRMEDKSKIEKSLRLVIPGDEINETEEISDETKVIVGPGLAREGSQVFSNRCGILGQKISAKIAFF